MVRAPFYDKNGIKRGAWSSEEDDKLRAYVERYGYWNWRQIPKYAGLSRCGKSCRLRWMNYLRPDVKRGNYTAEEVSLIIKLHEEHGHKWSLIAANLPGRTDNEIKNYWHTHLKKRTADKTPTTTSQSPREDRSCDDSAHQCEQTCHSTNGEAETESSNNHDAEEISLLPPILESSQSPADTISTNISPGSPSVLTSHTSSLSDSDFFSHENNNYLSSPLEALYEEYYSTGSDFWTEPFLEDNMCSLNDGSYLTCYGDGASSHGLSYYDDGTEMEYFFYQ